MWPFAEKRKQRRRTGKQRSGKKKMTKKKKTTAEECTEGVAEANPLMKRFVGKDRKMRNIRERADAAAIVGKDKAFQQGSK